jgi:membrane fusion protein (multidrug efflux system)
MNRRTRSHRFQIALAASLLALACGDDGPTSVIGAPPVLVAPATAHRVIDRIEATGQLLAQAEATVAAQVSGEITSITADEGSAVELGAIVVEIDPERRQLEVDNMSAAAVQAQAQLREARRELERVKQLAGHGAASEARLDEVRTRVDLARSGLVAAQAQAGLAGRALADASVTAPFAGLIARRRVSAGEYVNVGQELFDLVALDPVEVEFHLAEVDSSRVAIDQQVEVRVASFKGEIFVAEVSVVSPTIDRATRTRRVKAVLPNPEGRLLPGTFARVDLGVAERDGVVMIPKEAVLQRADGSIIFRLIGEDRVERLRIETGLHRDELVEVRGAVTAGDRIVVRGQTALIDGSAVSLRNADGSSAGPGEMDVAAGVNDG